MLTSTSARLPVPDFDCSDSQLHGTRLVILCLSGAYSTYAEYLDEHSLDVLMELAAWADYHQMEQHTRWIQTRYVHSYGDDLGDRYLALWCVMDDPRTGGSTPEMRSQAAEAIRAMQATVGPDVLAVHVRRAVISHANGVIAMAINAALVLLGGDQ